MSDRDWPLPATRLVSGDRGDRESTGHPACSVCGAELDIFTSPCPHCGTPDPLITLASIGWALLMLAGEIAVGWLIFRACTKS